MDSSEFRRRKELLRPAPLGLCRDSRTIKKPPRPPVIIYDATPKIIHAKPEEFMSLVQRLTGPSKNSATTSCLNEPSNCCQLGDCCRASGEKIHGTEQAGQSMDWTGSTSRMEPLPSHDKALADLSSTTDSIDDLFLDDLSPEFQGNKGFCDGSFGSSSAPSHLTFPGEANADRFNDLFDFDRERFL